MAVVLVVGATGQLGTAIVRLALKEGHRVAAFVRPLSNHGHLERLGAELRFGDLRDPSSLSVACRGVDAVIATATVTFPRGRYSFEEDEGIGYESLLDACRERGVGQFVFTSVFSLPEPYESGVPSARMKRHVERVAEESGVPYTIFRTHLLMDDYFALVGSRIPLRGAEAATLLRPFWFSRSYLRLVGQIVERRGLAILPGPRAMRSSFIALEDVARFHVRAIGHPSAQNRCFELGGPEALAWRDIPKLYERLLDRRVRGVSWPRGLARLLMRAVSRFSQAAENQLGILWIASGHEGITDSRDLSRTFGVPLTTAEEFLEGKLALPDPDRPAYSSAC